MKKRVFGSYNWPELDQCSHSLDVAALHYPKIPPQAMDIIDGVASSLSFAKAKKGEIVRRV